tara:strand:+ start:177 stop:614 length:438 start_codon:yes stop_codon:yes gene_type:complete
MTDQTPTNNDELREQLAAIEHERWSDWQKWCHQVIRENAPRNDELEAVLARWDRQIDVPYELLTDSEKASDMEQVDRYWPLITQHTEKAVREARIDELKSLVPPEQYRDYAKISGQVGCVMCGFDSEKFRSYIEDRIAQLKDSDD